MASFTGQTIAATYKRILTIDSENFAADASAKYIKDGDAGTASALSLSTTRVGIGTASPASILHVNAASSGASWARFTNTDGGISTTSGTVFGIDADEKAIIWNYENTDMYFGTNANRRMTILAGGRVGIGVSDPDSRLEINSNTSNILHLKNTDGNGCRMQMEDDSDIAYFGMSDAQDIAYFGFNEGAHGGNLNILSGGNVGVGTVAPSTPFHVTTTNVGIPGASANSIARFSRTDAGTASHGRTLLIGATDNGALWLQSHQTNNFAVDTILALNPEGGNVGIGTSSPASILHIEDDATQYLRFAPTGGYSFEHISSAEHTFSVAERSAKLVAMTINESGNVGIGTPTPSNPLHIYRATGSCTAAIQSADDNAVLAISADSGDTASTVDQDPKIQLYSAGAIQWYIVEDHDDTQKLEIQNASGTVRAHIAQGANGWVAGTSDERTKTNTSEIDGTLEKLSDIPCYTFNYKYGTDEYKSEPHLGVMAQDLISAFPDCPDIVTDKGVEFRVRPAREAELDENGDVILGKEARPEKACGAMGVAYDKLTVLLLKAVQELSTKITALENA